MRFVHVFMLFVQFFGRWVLIVLVKMMMLTQILVDRLCNIVIQVV